MSDKNTVSAVACFIAIPFWGWVMFSLYDYLAHKYGRPDNFLVNLTGLIGIAGLIFLIVTGIVYLVKAKKAKNKKKK